MGFCLFARRWAPRSDEHGLVVDTSDCAGKGTYDPHPHNTPCLTTSRAHPEWFVCKPVSCRRGENLERCVENSVLLTSEEVCEAELQELLCQVVAPSVVLQYFAALGCLSVAHRLVLLRRLAAREVKKRRAEAAAAKEAAAAAKASASAQLEPEIAAGGKKKSSSKKKKGAKELGPKFQVSNSGHQWCQNFIVGSDSLLALLPQCRHRRK
eukprot:SAG31_NODE_12962_length_903_cov_4.952736_2_plen_210_part_00